MGVLGFLFDEKVRVPEDVSLISFDGIAGSEFTHPSLTTISTPLFEIDRSAFELLAGPMAGRFTELQNVVLPVRMVSRESAGVARRERPS